MVAQTGFADDQNRSSSDGNANVRYVVHGGNNQRVDQRPFVTLDGHFIRLIFRVSVAGN
jgi:hypothetical protein